MWPNYIQSSGNTGQDCFRKNAEFSCSASECLSLYGPIRHFLKTLNLHESGDRSVRLTARSLVLALNLLELCHSSMRVSISPDTLHKYVIDHLKAFKLAHGEEAVLPKHHFMLHVAQSMRETGYLTALCWRENIRASSSMPTIGTLSALIGPSSSWNRSPCLSAKG